MADWIDTTPVLMLAFVFLLCMAVATLAGFWARRAFFARTGVPDAAGQEAYIVSAVLGLLALLLGFTLSLSLDRFETRRALVLEEANAIGTAYLRSQLLAEPHRTRVTGLLVDYLDNRLAFADTTDPSARQEFLKTDDQLTVDLWAAAAAVFDEIRTIDFSSAYLDSINAVLDLDTSRRTAQAARIPAEVFGMLGFFALVASALLGFILTGPRRYITAGLLLLLLSLALTMMLDIDRPSAGWVKEPQEPLLALRKSISTTPPSAYDRWRTPPA